MLQFGVSLTDDASSVNYDRNVFTIQATDLKFAGKAARLPIKRASTQVSSSLVSCVGVTAREKHSSLFVFRVSS
jgi:hypothetical protein